MYSAILLLDIQKCYTNFNHKWLASKLTGFQPFIAMYDSGCVTCCNWSRLKPGFMRQRIEFSCRW